jgi:hypothetical protein
MTRPELASGFLPQAVLLTKMAGRSQTDGWDIACAYDAAKLNDVLKTLYKADDSKLVKTIRLGDQDHPYNATYAVFYVPGVFRGLSLSITEGYTFELQEPSLQFLTVPHTAAVNMPIKSARVVMVNASLKLLDPQPANVAQLTNANAWYRLVDGSFVAATAADVEQAIGNDNLTEQFYQRVQAGSLNGKDDVAYQNKAYQLVDIRRKEPQDVLDGSGYALGATVPLVSVTGNGTVTSGDDVVTFDTVGDSAKVVLHFKTGAGSGAKFDLYQGGSKTAPQLLADAPDILDQIENYFGQHVGEIDYTLSTIESKPVGSIQLTPRSFRFATQAAIDDSDSGTLTVFIQTRESGLDQGGGNLVFQDEIRQPFLPVCAAANTTVIYSRAFMSRYYLIQGLTSDHFTSVTNSGTDNQPITVTGHYESNVTISIPDMHDIGGYYKVTVDSVALGGLDVTMAFDKQNQVRVTSSTSKGTSIGLYSSTGTPYGPASSEHHVDATIEVTLDQTIPLTWKVREGATLELWFAVTGFGYHVDVQSGISQQCGDTTRDMVDKQIGDEVAKALPTITLPMGGLCALAEENLLFSGQKKFLLAPALGIHTPQDVVLFGNV